MHLSQTTTQIDSYTPNYYKIHCTRQHHGLTTTAFQIQSSTLSFDSTLRAIHPRALPPSNQHPFTYFRIHNIKPTTLPHHNCQKTFPNQIHTAGHTGTLRLKSQSKEAETGDHRLYSPYRSSPSKARQNNSCAYVFLQRGVVPDDGSAHED